MVGTNSSFSQVCEPRTAKLLNPSKRIIMKIICLGNYPPRQCGIATFTENLVNAITNSAKIESASFEIEVIAMNDCSMSYTYPAIVKKVIRNEIMDDYIHAANYINDSGSDLF